MIPSTEEFEPTYLLGELVAEPAVHVELRGEGHDERQGLQRVGRVAPALPTQHRASCENLVSGLLGGWLPKFRENLSFSFFE